MKTQKHSFEGLLALLLFGVFAVCLLTVLLTGANTYRSLTGRDQAAYSRRTCAQYIAARVRQADRLGAVEVAQFGDGDALALTEDIDGVPYVTRVYLYDGWLMELFCNASYNLAPRDGEKILQADAMSLTLADSLLGISITEDGGSEPIEFTLALRAGEGAAA